MDTGRPFELSTDLGFLYKSDEHETVFQQTLKAIEKREGLICITGEPGTGKTLLCERLSAELNGAYEPFYISNPSQALATMMGARETDDGEPSPKAPVFIVDEAQHLDPGSLDELKFLWNHSMANGTSLHVVLVGQPELAESIAQNAPLAQRVGANLALGHLERDEVFPYVTSRVAKAEMAGKVRFTQGAARVIFRKTGGVPRLVNRLAQIVLERAQAKGKGQIGAWDVYRAASSLSVVKPSTRKPSLKRHRVIVGSLGFLATVVLGTVLYGPPLQINHKPSVPVERYSLKLGPFVTREGAQDAAQDLQKDDFKVTIKEERLADGWVVYGVYLSGTLEKAQAKKIAEVLKTRYGFESSLISMF